VSRLNYIKFGYGRRSVIGTREVLNVSHTLLRFEATATKRQLGSKVEVKVRTF